MSRFESLVEYHVRSDGRGDWLVALPIVPFPGEAIGNLAQRERTAQYLVDNILACPILRPGLISTPKLLRKLVRSLVIEMALGPISTLLRCRYRDIARNLETDPATAGLLHQLLAEAHPIIEQYSPGLTVPDMLHLVMDRLELDPAKYNPMLESISLGYGSDVDSINGFIVMRGKELGIKCPTHEGMIQMVKEEAAKATANIKSSMKSKFRNKYGPFSSSRRMKWHVPEKRSQQKTSRKSHHSDEIRLDRIEKKWLNKEQAQKEMLGKQPMPAHFAKPQISPLGNSKLTKNPIL